MKKKIKLIALDMDGTLLCDDHQTISQRTKYTLCAAVARGILVVPATGRAQAMLPEQLFEVDGLRYAITSNGAAIRDMQESKDVYSDLISPDTMRDIFNVFEPYHLFSQIYCRGKIYVERDNLENTEKIPFHPAFVEEIRKRQVPVDDFETLLQKYPEGAEKYNIPHLESELRSHLWEQLSDMPGVSLTSAIPENMEINSKTCNKARALSHLCRMLDIQPESVMVVGDSGNDLEMLSFTENSFAMANGTDKAKDAAHYMTSSNEEDGVAKAIEAYAL